MAHAGIPSHQVSALFPLTHPLQIFFIYTRHSLWQSRHVKQLYLLTNEIVCDTFVPNSLSWFGFFPSG